MCLQNTFGFLFLSQFKFSSFHHTFCSSYFFSLHHKTFLTQFISILDFFYILSKFQLPSSSGLGLRVFGTYFNGISIFYCFSILVMQCNTDDRINQTKFSFITFLVQYEQFDHKNITIFFLVWRQRNICLSLS